MATLPPSQHRQRFTTARPKAFDPYRDPLANSAVLPLVFQAIIVLAAAVVWLRPDSRPDGDVLSVALLVLFLWCLCSWKAIGRKIFGPYALFLTSAFMFNAGQSFLEVFGLNDRGILAGAFSDQIVAETLAVVLLGLSSLHLGALLRLALSPLQTAGRLSAAKSTVSGMRGIGWALLLVSLPFVVIWLSQAVSAAANAGYSSLYDRDVETGLSASPFVLSGLFVPALLLLTGAGRTYPFERRLAAVLIMTMVALEFYIGYRGIAVMPLIAWAWLRHRAVKPIRPGLLLATAAALLLVIFPVVRETRDLAFGERSIEGATRWFDFRDNPGVTTISEMGGSMATIAHTLTMVPTSRAFSSGEDYAYALLTLFPNLAWDIHPTKTHGTLSDWLAAAVYAGWNSRGAGLGFSFIAEAYVNFGPSGPLIMMALFGFIIAGIDNWSTSTEDVGKLALVAIILAVILRFPRDELSGVVRSVVWYGYGPYLAAMLLPDIAQGAIRVVRVRHPKRGVAP